MNLLNKLTIKSLKLNKKRTIVTVIGIILSVALITAVASMYSSGIQSLISYEKMVQGDFHVAYYNVSMSDVDMFKNNRKIENVIITKNMGYAKIDSKNEDKPYAYVKGFTKNALENLSVNLVDGRLPENENEIVIPTHLKTNGRLFLHVGDELVLNVGKRVNNIGEELSQADSFTVNDTGDENIANNDANVVESNNENISSIDNSTEILSESIIDTETKTYKIVGIIQRPAMSVEPYSAPGYTFITYIDENKLEGNVDIFVRYAKENVKNALSNTAQILGVDEELFTKAYQSDRFFTDDEMRAYLEQMSNAKYKINANSYLIDMETNPIHNNSIGKLGTVVGIVIAIIVFTSVFCIKNSFDISITEKTKQYGMLRSVGATKKQIKRNVFYEATVLGFMGIPFGALSGFLASYILVLVSNYLIGESFGLNFKLEFSFSYIAVLIAVILGSITIYLSAFKSTRRAAKISPIDSIRNSGNIRIKSRKVKSPKIIKKLFGIGGEISFKNLKRNRKKYRTTVISIIVSVSVFIALSSFMSMAFDEVENELKISEFNISLTANAIDEKTYEKYVDVTKLDNIEEYSIIKGSGIEVDSTHYNREYMEWTGWNYDDIEDAYISVIAVGEEQYQKYIESLGLDYDYIKDKGILVDYNQVISRDEKDNKYVKKYMRMLDYSKNDVIEGNITNNNEAYSIEIGAIVKEKPFGFKNQNENFLIMSDEMYNQKFYTSYNFSIFIRTNDASGLQNAIDEYLKDEDYTLNNIDENTRMMKNVFTLMGIFLYGFIIVISLIGITNIFNTITTNMELRKQEFAMLKSIGMTTGEFRRMIRLETLFMGAKSLLWGIPIGGVLSYLIYSNLKENSGLPYEVPTVAIGISVVAVFVLISCIMKYSMNKISKQNTIETIRNENI